MFSRKRNRKRTTLQNRLDEMLEIPEEVASKEPKMGFKKMLIENYKGILEYQDFYIRLSTYTGIMNINGFNLSVKEMTTEDVQITGKIESIDFEENQSN